MEYLKPADWISTLTKYRTMCKNGGCYAPPTRGVYCPVHYQRAIWRWTVLLSLPNCIIWVVNRIKSGSRPTPELPEPKPVVLGQWMED